MDSPSTQPTVQPAPRVPVQSSQEVCPKCKTPVTPADIFCPHCGNQLVRQVSVLKQIWIYFVSLALPPLGLTWTFRYIRSQYKQVKYVGIAALVLTIVSSAATIWFTYAAINTVNQQVQKQLNSSSYFNY